MEGYRDAELRVTAAVRALSRADEGKSIKELDALDHFGGFRDLFSTRPANEERAATAMRIRTQLAGFNRIEPTALNGWPRSATAAELSFIEGSRSTQPCLYHLNKRTSQKPFAKASAPTHCAKESPWLRASSAARIPLGADAPTKTLRKVIGGGGELLETAAQRLLCPPRTSVGTVVPVGGTFRRHPMDSGRFRIRLPGRRGLPAAKRDSRLPELAHDHARLRANCARRNRSHAGGAEYLSSFVRNGGNLRILLMGPN